MRRTIHLSLSAVVLCMAMTGPGCSGRPTPYTGETFVMGTRCVIQIYGMDEDRARQASGKAFRELHRIESMMSNWVAESEISRLNAGGKGVPVEVSGELFDMLKSSLEYSSMTGGAFDVTARPLVRLWGFERTEGEGPPARVPSDAEIAAALARCGYGRVGLEDGSVTLAEGMEIDLAGIGKGYGVDRCVAVLRGEGVTSALVDLSGNMFAIGTPPGRDGWSIGLRDPRGGTGIVGTTLISEEGIATSGNYENFVEIDGTRYGHIVDPRTGRTVDHLLAVTVVAPTAMEADALSTGMFVMGPEESRELCGTLSGVRAVFARDDDSFEFLGGKAWNLGVD